MSVGGELVDLFNCAFPSRSQQYEEARASLLYSFTQRYSECTVPCFVSDGNPPEEDRQAQPAWR